MYVQKKCSRFSENYASTISILDDKRVMSIDRESSIA